MADDLEWLFGCSPRHSRSRTILPSRGHEVEPLKLSDRVMGNRLLSDSGFVEKLRWLLQLRISIHTPLWRSTSAA